MTGHPQLINSHDSWSQLLDVWLGDVYPATWYDHLDIEIRDVLHEITEKTKHDLGIIQQKLETLGVTVHRPRYEKIEDCIVTNDSDPALLIKPQLTPRDQFSVIGNTLMCPPKDHKDLIPWRHLIDNYAAQHQKIDHRVYNKTFQLIGIHLLRTGRDIFVHTQDHHKAKIEMNKIFGDQFEQYRVHFIENFAHMHGLMEILGSDLALCTAYHLDYESLFPDWKFIRCTSNEFADHPKFIRPRTIPGTCGKWFIDQRTFDRAFNHHVLKHALTWHHTYCQSFWELNCLVVDERNVLFLGQHDELFRALEQHGITCHAVPFRCRSFWDGGLHCITLDIRRKNQLKDFH